MFPRLLLRSLLARRSRATLALLAVSLGIAVATTLGTLALQVGDDFARALRAAGPNFVVSPAGARWSPDLGGARIAPARAGLVLGDSVVALLKTTFWKNNVLEAAPELDEAARLGAEAVTITGTWFERDVPTVDGPWQTGLARLRPAWRVEGRWPEARGREIALGRSLATRLGIAAGDSVEVRMRASVERWRVSGVVSAGGLDDRRAWAPLTSVQTLAGRPAECDRVLMSALVLPEPRTPIPDPRRDPASYERYMCRSYPAVVAADLEQNIHGIEVQPLSEVVAAEADVVGRLNLLMLLLALAALTASTLGLVSTTTATVVERAAEFGLMRSLGAGSLEITWLLLAETGLVSLAGGWIGWALGTGAAALIRGGAFAGAAASPVLLLPVALTVALVVGVLGTLVPLRVALRMDPVEVLHA